jgi:hypothetical protein
MLIFTMSSAKPCVVYYHKFTASFVVTCHTYDTLALFFVRAAYVVLILQILVLRFMEILLHHLASHFELLWQCPSYGTYLRGQALLCISRKETKKKQPSSIIAILTSLSQ